MGKARFSTTSLAFTGAALFTSLLVFTSSTGQIPPGDGHQCSYPQNTDCENTPPWDGPTSMYEVACCCGEGGVGSSGILCQCTVREYERYDQHAGSICYLTSCHTSLEEVCVKGPNLGNVKWATK